MDRNLEILLNSLDNEIEKKCFEIKQKRLQKAMESFFILVCGLLLVIPFMLIFFQINIIIILMPIAIFIGIAVLALLPLILGSEIGGVTNEKIS